MAHDCDNESIVIEDSVRKSFFNFLDSIAGEVFDKIFNLWAMKINTYQFNEDDYKSQKLKYKLIDAFYHWIKIRLPDQVFANMVENYPEIIKLVFAELEGEEESLENATNCVCELILLAKKKSEFSGIKNYVINHIGALTNKVNEIVAE